MTPLEKDVEKAFCRMVGSLGGMALKWVCPGWAGVPDRIVLLPGGRVVFAEMKRPGGSIAPRQRWWAEKLEGLGFVHVYVWSQEDVLRVRRIFQRWQNGSEGV